MNKILKIIIIILPILLLTGCTSYTELNDLGIVSMLGLDYQDNEYQVYVNIIEGTQDDGILEKKYKTHYSSAPNLEEAFQKIMIQSDKKVYLSHIDLLLITENLVDNRLKDTLYNFLNNNEYRNNFNIALTKTDLKSYFDNEITADEINKQISINNKESGTVSEIDFELFLRALLIDSNSFLPTISWDKGVKIEGFSLIKDYRIFAYLNHDESILFNLMSNRINKTLWKNYIIYQNETTIKTNKNKVQINLKTLIDKNKEEFKKELTEDIKKLWNLYREKDYDILKLQHKIKQNNFSYYKKTKDLLNKIELKVNIEPTIKNNYIEED